jgi:hypothetical protein
MVAFNLSLDLMMLLLLHCNRNLTGKELKVPRHLFED